MAIDKKITYEDQRLTKAQQKKAKPVKSAGIKNYLGKQETVTVPKKWLSSPDHVVAELAYITPREQKILLDANLYGSLNGKPNRGPGGIMSLQGAGDGGGSENAGTNNDGSSMGGGTGPSVEAPPGVTANPSAPTDGTEGTLSDPREKFDYKTTTIGPKDKTGGFFDSGLGKFVKNLAIGTILGPAVLGGTKIGGLLSTANTLNNVAGMFGKDIDVKSALGNVGTLGDTFAGFSTTGTKGPKDPTDDRGNGDGGNEKNALLSEYISLLQRMEQGMLSAEEQGRFNSLKSRLGKAQGGIMNVNMNKGKLGVMNG